MGRASESNDAIRHAGTGHVQRCRNIGSPVVDTGQDVTVKINHMISISIPSSIAATARGPLSLPRIEVMWNTRYNKTLSARAARMPVPHGAAQLLSLARSLSALCKASHPMTRPSRRRRPVGTRKGPEGTKATRCNERCATVRMINKQSTHAEYYETCRMLLHRHKFPFPTQLCTSLRAEQLRESD